MTAPIYDEAFSEDHGDLACLVKCFEQAVEMNFVLGDGIGTTVGLEASALVEEHGLVAGAREIVVDARDDAA